MITQNLVIYPALNPVRTCGKYSEYKVRQECFNGAMTRMVHIAILVNKTGNVMDFTLFYVFLLVINTTSLYLSGTVLFCIHFLSTLHHDGMVHSITTECTMLSNFQFKLMKVQSLGHMTSLSDS